MAADTGNALAACPPLPNSFSCLRDLEAGVGESTNAIRQELNRKEEADLLNPQKEGSKKTFQANRKHSLFYVHLYLTKIHNVLVQSYHFTNILKSCVTKQGNYVQSIQDGTEFKITDHFMNNTC